MPIGRMSMTKEMFGNRTKKMSTGGSVVPGDGGKETTSKALKTAETPAMKKGGKVQSNFIASAIKKPGSLRKSLGVKKGETIPAATLSAAAKKPGKMGQRARFAETLKKMK